MTVETKKIGKIGELVVARHLEKMGYKVVSRNYRKKWGEIDVIARLGETIHFVEVKTVSRESLNFLDAGSYSPEENVHPEKLRRMSRTIQSYLMEEKVSDETPWQIDVAGVFLNLQTKQARIRMTENVVV